MNEITVSDAVPTSVSELMFNASAMESVMAFGKMMAASKVTIPNHLQGKPEDCAAVVLQAMQWRFNPYAVAQKTHVTQGGALGYEAQLVNAAIITSGKIEAAPEFEFIGDWNKILGKVEERKSDKGGKYYVAVWEKKDEAELGVIVSATLVGERDPRTVTVLLAQAWPRFSTQWATDPQQQITYLAVRKFARRYTPQVILGVYTNDEIEPSGVIDMGAAEEVPLTPQRRSAQAPAPVSSGLDQATGEVPPPKAPPAATPATVTVGCINGGQVKYLQQKITALELSDETVKAMLARLGIAGLDTSMTADQFDTLKSELLAAA